MMLSQSGMVVFGDAAGDLEISSVRPTKAS
jgi:hypothetical protein